MSVPLLFCIRLELSGCEWVWPSFYVVLMQVCMCVRVCLLKSDNYIFYVYLFVHEEISICVYTRCSKVEDGADSLCAVYYRILCNYIITANHPPEVA